MSSSNSTKKKKSDISQEQQQACADALVASQSAADACFPNLLLFRGRKKPLSRREECEALVKAMDAVHTIAGGSDSLDMTHTGPAEEGKTLQTDCLETAHAWLHRVPGCAYTAEWRMVYGLAGLLETARVMRMMLLAHSSSLSSSSAEEVVRLLDMLWMFGPQLCRAAVIAWSALACTLLPKDELVEDNKRLALFQSSHGKPDEVPVVLREDPKGARAEVPRIDCPGVDWFASHCLPTQSSSSSGGTPVLLTGTMTQWPAVQKWQSGSFWLDVLSFRWVPVEIGSQYTSEDWEVKMMRGQDFFAQFLLSQQEPHDDNKEGKVGYLAQHDLLEQLPVLKQDVTVPAYCFATTDEVKADTVLTKAWIGPRHTVTPIHYDRDHNIFAQVVGSKYIRLYDPKHTDAMLLHASDSVNHNTSRVNLLALENASCVVSTEELDRFRAVPFLDVVVNPGEALFIPKGWFHFVLSLSTSVSLSHWFP